MNSNNIETPSSPLGLIWDDQDVESWHKQKPTSVMGLRM
jgi:hypothetical protein